jgi:hypothetical protein
MSWGGVYQLSCLQMRPSASRRRHPARAAVKCVAPVVIPVSRPVWQRCFCRDWSPTAAHLLSAACVCSLLCSFAHYMPHWTFRWPAHQLWNMGVRLRWRKYQSCLRCRMPWGWHSQYHLPDGSWPTTGQLRDGGGCLQHSLPCYTLANT